MFNREKALKVAEKQKALVEKMKEFEKLQQEELLKKQGCPLKKAEKMFHESIERVTRERTEKYKEIAFASVMLDK